jgi:hypothetical protein
MKMLIVMHNTIIAIPSHPNTLESVTSMFFTPYDFARLWYKNPGITKNTNGIEVDPTAPIMLPML